MAQNPALGRLLAPIKTLEGVTPRLAALLSRLLAADGGRPRIVDLLFHLPVGVIAHDMSLSPDEVVPGARATLEVTVLGHRQPSHRRQPYRVCCEWAGERLDLVFFRGSMAYLQAQLPLNGARIVSGALSRYGALWQMVHPELILRPEGEGDGRWLQPVYPLTQGLSQRLLARSIASALAHLDALPEWQDPAWLEQQRWPDFAQALRRIHQPEQPDDLEPKSRFRSRLAFDELLALQLKLAASRASRHVETGRVHQGDMRLRRLVLDALPFALTAAQNKALEAIGADMASKGPMLRLLQGDVGSGKTIVAAIAMLQAVESGAQAALMAPTEVLVRQHADALAAIMAPAGVATARLTGREPAPERRRVLDGLQSGAIRVVIGTHALVQQKVAFADLGLVVIDEQHRFGVNQRAALAAKGSGVDVLIMTATPIPRTLVLSCYGDIALSELREKPAGRRPIDTRAVPINKLDEVMDAIGRALTGGRQIYWICPLVEISSSLDLAAATSRHEALRARFGSTVGLIHGQMRSADKERAMQAFAAGDLRVLVATTVIEVGIDVPGASVIVIEHAERFGLAQLHQLRGRVGRGSDSSSCILLYAEPLTRIGRRRLEVMRKSDDGFYIAEEDLKLRGPGEILGTRQSGLPIFKIADPAAHGPLLRVARDHCLLILSRPGDGFDSPARLLDRLFDFGNEAAARRL